MLRRNLVLALAGGLILAACSLPKPDAKAEAAATALYEQIRTGADLSANLDLAPELKTSQALAELAAVRTSLPEGAPTGAAVRAWNFNAGTGGSTVRLVHAYSYPSRVVLAETVLAKDASKTWKITGFHVTFEDPSARPAPPQGEPAVTVTDKPKDI